MKHEHHSQYSHDSLLDIEELSEEELDRIKARFEELARKARKASSVGQTEVKVPVLKSGVS